MPDVGKQTALSAGEKFQQSVKHILRDYAEALAIAITLALVIRIFVVSAYKIPTSSMAPSLISGDYIFAYKLPYSFRSLNVVKTSASRLPRRGQVVVFKCPQNRERSCIKRVVGLPGDRIEVVGKRLFVNRNRADYSISSTETSSPDGLVVVNESISGSLHTILISSDLKHENFGPVVVAPGAVFVLADNRDSLEDSRVWGSVPAADLQAEALFVWMSADWSQSWAGGNLPGLRWARLFRGI